MASGGQLHGTAQRAHTSAASCGATSNFGQNFFFHGASNEVSVYDRVLSSGDIGAIVAAGRGQVPISSSVFGTGNAFLGGSSRNGRRSRAWVTFTFQGSACQETLTSAKVCICSIPRA